MEAQNQLVFSPTSTCYRCHPRLPTRTAWGWPRHRGPVRVRAEDASSRQGFDEGAAQVKRLVNRDRSAFSGKDFDQLLEQEFGESKEKSRQKQEDPASSTSAANGEPSSTGSVKPSAGFNLRKSPFAVEDPSAKSPLSPFGSSVPSSPFGEPKLVESKEAEPSEEEPWWSFVKSITLTQVVIFCSFSLIISLMVGTFVFVFNTGAVHFNE